MQLEVKYRLDEGSPVYVERMPLNRYEKRTLVKECLNLEEPLLDIQKEFIDTIYNTEFVDYKLYYSFFLEQWNKTMDRLSKQKRIRYAKLDRNFFMDFYFPLEKEMEGGVIIKLRNLIYGEA